MTQLSTLKPSRRLAVRCLSEAYPTSLSQSAVVFEIPTLAPFNGAVVQRAKWRANASCRPEAGIQRSPKRSLRHREQRAIDVNTDYIFYSR
jgi:hypothetical protein